MKEIVPPKLKPLVVNDPEDVALKWTGEKVMSDKPVEKPVKKRRSSARSIRRKYRQQAFAITNDPQLERLSEVMGVDKTAVVNLGLAALAKQWL